MSNVELIEMFPVDLNEEWREFSGCDMLDNDTEDIDMCHLKAGSCMPSCTSKLVAAAGPLSAALCGYV